MIRIIMIITMAILIINIRILIMVICIFVIEIYNTLSVKPQTTPKLSSQIISEDLSCSLSVCFLYNILELNPRVKGNQSQKETLMNHDIMQQSYLDLNVQRCLLKVLSIKKKKKKNENQSINDWKYSCWRLHFCSLILLIYFWGAFKKGSIAPQ